MVCVTGKGGPRPSLKLISAFDWIIKIKCGRLYIVIRLVFYGELPTLKIVSYFIRFRSPQRIQRCVFCSHSIQIAVGINFTAVFTFRPTNKVISDFCKRISGKSFFCVRRNSYIRHFSTTAVRFKMQHVVVRRPNCIKNVLSVCTHHIIGFVAMIHLTVGRSTPTGKSIAFLCIQTFI